MSDNKQVVVDRLGGDDIWLYKSQIVDGGLYVESQDPKDLSGGFTLDVKELLQAMHDLGIHVTGFVPKKPLQEQVEDLLTATLAVKQPERARQIIALVQGYES